MITRGRTCFLVATCGTPQRFKGRGQRHAPLHFGRAGPTGFDFAMRTLVYVPMRAGVALVAVPEDEVGIRLDHLE
jgi:hypothetical protein